jgi:ubiquinone/menaquinone biosynthesis C-methylase UbiE
MRTTPIRPWAIDREISSPFAFPTGWLGHLAGRFMLWTYDHAEVLDLLDLQPGQRVLEVGPGAGGLLRDIDRLGVASEVHAVDPSPEMVDAASRRNRAGVEAGRVRITRGTAAETGLPDAHFDRVVSVHTVALWPDLERGLDELHRVTRPGGMVVLAWHGGRTEPMTTRKLRLPEDKLARIERGLSERFARFERRAITRDDLFRAWR